MHVYESKVPPPGLKIRTPAPMQVPLNLIRPNETNDSNASKVPALRPTLESVDAFQPDAGPNRMTRMHRKSWPWGQTLDPLDSFDSGPGSEANAANASKVMACVWGRL